MSCKGQYFENMISAYTIIPFNNHTKNLLFNVCYEVQIDKEKTKYDKFRRHSMTKVYCKRADSLFVKRTQSLQIHGARAKTTQIDSREKRIYQVDISRKKSYHATRSKEEN